MLKIHKNMIIYSWTTTDDDDGRNAWAFAYHDGGKFIYMDRSTIPDQL